MTPRHGRSACADQTETPDVHHALARVLDDLERHRSEAVEDRLRAAAVVRQKADALGWTLGSMRARLVVADMQHRTGAIDEAARTATEVNGWATANGHRALAGRSHLVLSSIFEAIGDVGSALEQVTRAVELQDDATPDRVRAVFVRRLADVLAVTATADHDEARRRYREAERIFAGLDDPERELVTLNNNLAMLELETGNIAAAVAAVTRIQEIDRDAWLDPATADTAGRVLLAAGQFDDAEAVLRTGARLLAEQGDAQAVTPAELALTLAEVLLAQGRLDEVDDELGRCERICDERGLTGERVHAWRVRADLLAARGRFAEALDAHRRFHGSYVELRSRQTEAAARTRHALFETEEARRSAAHFWRQARTDPLTELPNRRFVDEELPRYLGGIGRDHGRLMVAIIDVDRFKAVNDTFSHEVGDAVLRRIGHLLGSHVAHAGVPAVDGYPMFAARLGGEEFLVATTDRGVSRAPDAPDPSIVGPFDTMRQGVESASWADLHPELRITMSIGVACAGPDDTMSSLLSRADAALYEAKATGRNRTVAARC